MPVVSFMNAEDFDVTKSYYNKLKSKEEICYLVLENYRNQELNDAVKAVIVEEEVEEVRQGVSYIKQVEFTSELGTLEEFVEQLIDPTDIYTYVIKLEKEYNDLRVLTNLVSKYTDTKLRFIGGNLLALEGTGVGFFSNSFINCLKLKTKSTVRFDFTQVKTVESSTLVTRGIEELQTRINRKKKSTVTKSKSTSKPAKPKKKKRTAMEIMSSY